MLLLRSGGVIARRCLVPRLREPVRPPSAESVPVELLDPEDPAWVSPESAFEWIADAGVSDEVLVAASATELRRLEWGPKSRHSVCAGLWALSYGWSKPWCAVNPRLVPDLPRLRDAGVPLAGFHGYLREQFDSAGVRVEGREKH